MNNNNEVLKPANWTAPTIEEAYLRGYVDHVTETQLNQKQLDAAFDSIGGVADWSVVSRYLGIETSAPNVDSQIKVEPKPEPTIRKPKSKAVTAPSKPESIKTEIIEKLPVNKLVDAVVDKPTEPIKLIQPLDVKSPKPADLVQAAGELTLPSKSDAKLNESGKDKLRIKIGKKIGRLALKTVAVTAVIATAFGVAKPDNQSMFNSHNSRQSTETTNGSSDTSASLASPSETTIVSTVAETNTGVIDSSPPKAQMAVGPATTTPETTTSVPKDLYEQINSGETSLDQHRGEFLGTLMLDKYCDDVSIYVNQFFDYNDPAVQPHLTEQAKANIAILNSGKKLNSDQKLILEDDIWQNGLTDGQNIGGSPMYQLQKDETPAACFNPRDSRLAYGSSQAVNNGGNAAQYQAIAEISEFADIPSAKPGNVTLIAGHRSTQSAPFYGMPDYQSGDTVSYRLGSGEVLTYRLARQEHVTVGDKELKQVIDYTKAVNADKSTLLIQYCPPDKPNDRIFAVFELAN